MPSELTIAALSRPPSEVASSLASWQRGDLADAILDTLELSARSTFQRAYTAWIWAGVDPSGGPVWLLPVEASEVETFAPASTMVVLTRSILAAHDAGADPGEVTLFDWDGMTGLRSPGCDPALAEVAMYERHRSPGKARIARIPDELRPDGPTLECEPLESATSRRTGLVAAANEIRAHPVRVAFALVSQGWDLEEERYPDDVIEMLRHSGLEGPARRPDAPSLAIHDDPCPRRRHARRVLRRLLHARKVGRGYHTEFAHLARGVPPDDRADALLIGEALLRAGLLGEKPSVGQRHVYLRREALPQIHALIDRGETLDPALAVEWTAPAPA